ncbi:MAG: glycosyltransferase family 2 protein [Planctomycetota bacterium]
MNPARPVVEAGEPWQPLPQHINGTARNYTCDLSVVIPVYNEEAGISSTVAHLKEYLSKQPWRTEIVCVDDGSTDRTPELLAQLEGIRVLSAAKNGGYGAALKLGFAAARGRYIGFCDADETYPVRMLGPMLAMLESRPDVPLVAGSRLLGSGEGLSLLRRSGNLMLTLLSRTFCRTAATDACSGMLVLREELRAQLELETFTDDLDFSLQMRCRCGMRGIPVLELPIPYEDRAGDSKLSPLRHGVVFTKRILIERREGKRWQRNAART